MNILVLNGSPKGPRSVTMQSVEYLKIKFPDVSFETVHISQSLHAIESKQGVFDEVMGKVVQADVVLFAFPLYHLLVHANYKRFIELVIERKKAGVFRNKYAAIFTTSIKFFDHIAHNYCEAVINDWGMKFCGSFSALMNDLMIKAERECLEKFFGEVLDCVQTGSFLPPRYRPLVPSRVKYKPGKIKPVAINYLGKIVIISDTPRPGSNIEAMIETFRSMFSVKPELWYLSKLKINGGCLGCIKCGFDNICAYEGKDDFGEFYKSHVLGADILIIAGEMKDRYFSAELKRFYDRSFFMTHQPVFSGKQIGYIVSGPLAQEQNFRQILEAYPDFHRGNCAGIITDELPKSSDIDRDIADLARRAVRLAQKSYIKPQSFIGYGGMKVFRDEIFLDLRLVFDADYRYYRSHGIFDFPHNRIGMRVLSRVLSLLLRVPPIRKKFRNEMIVPGMIMPHQAILGQLRRGRLT